MREHEGRPRVHADGRAVAGRRRGRAVAAGRGLRRKACWNTRRVLACECRRGPVAGARHACRHGGDGRGAADTGSRARCAAAMRECGRQRPLRGQLLLPQDKAARTHRGVAPCRKGASLRWRPPAAPGQGGGCRMTDMHRIGCRVARLGGASPWPGSRRLGGASRPLDTASGPLRAACGSCGAGARNTGGRGQDVGGAPARPAGGGPRAAPLPRHERLLVGE